MKENGIAEAIPLRLSKKWLRHFFEKAALRSAPRLSAKGGQFDARSARSIFCDVQKVNCAP